MKMKNWKHDTQCWAGFRPEASQAWPGPAAQTPWTAWAGAARSPTQSSRAAWSWWCGRPGLTDGQDGAGKAARAPVQHGGPAWQGEAKRGSPKWRGGLRAVGWLGGGDIRVADGSPVGNDGGGEVLEHQGANRGVSHRQKEKETAAWWSSPRKGKSGGGGSECSGDGDGFGDRMRTRGQGGAY
jgi:hypothetical protein